MIPVIITVHALCRDTIRTCTVVAMHIQVSEEMFAALTASKLGYSMRQRGEVEIKVKQCMNFCNVLVSSNGFA